MACLIRCRRGRLVYRLRWDANESQEGTGLRDTPTNRARLGRKAAAITDEMAEGRFDYLRWFPNGNKSQLFRPASAASVPVPTVREYAEGTWLPRKLPPYVRATLARTYRKHLQKHVLPAFGDTPINGVTPAALEDFRAMMTRPEAEGGRGLTIKTARDVIDGTFRALHRDARSTDRLVTD